MNQKHKIRHIFLQSFVAELISNTNPAAIPVSYQDQPEEQAINDIINIRKRISENKMRPSAFRVKQVSINKPITVNRIAHPLKTQITQPMTKSMQISASLADQAQSFPRPNAGIPLARPIQGNLDLGKINFLINDPSIQGIECPGPNKRILVKKDGITQTTHLILTKQEIEKLIHDFSIKTNIPLIGGMLKVAFGNLILTAVMSEFVGSRFILQKKNPFRNSFY